MGKEKRAAGMFFTDGIHALILKRNDKYWDLPGGRVEDDETFLGGAQREVKEEIGLLPSCRRLGYINIKEGKKDIYRVYVCLVKNTFEVALSEEHKDYKWCDLDKLEKKDLHPGLFKILDELLNMSRKKVKINENNMGGFASFLENSDTRAVIRQMKKELRKRPTNKTTRLILADALEEIGDTEQAEIQRLIANRRFIIPMDREFLHDMFITPTFYQGPGRQIRIIASRLENGLNIYSERELQLVIGVLEYWEEYYEGEVGHPDLDDEVTEGTLNEIRRYLERLRNYDNILRRHN